MSQGIEMTAAPPSSRYISQLRNILQQAVQAVKWTYSIYWKLCPQQRILVWSEGYYNGEIKTRKTVDLKEVSTEAASLQRSQQLRDLYESLCAAGGVASETNHKTSRPPSAALLPEDLTESEWFYLLCLSYFFPPAVGLPGSAYAKKQHVWLTGASEADTHLFPRALLAKSAKIQTVVCIPLLDGVVELGTTLNVPENPDFIQRVINFFNQSQEQTLSQHSTSNPPYVSGFGPSSSSKGGQPAAYITTISPLVAADMANHSENDHEVAEKEACGGDVLETNDISGDSDALSFDDVIYSPLLIQNPSYIPNDDIRIGSIGGESNDDMVLDYVGRLQYVEDDPQIQPSHSQFSPPAQEEDTYFSQTVPSLLQGQSRRCSEISSATSYIHHSPHTAFFKWSFSGFSASDRLINGRFSQKKLKYIIYTVPHLHSKDNNRSKKSSSFTRASSKASSHQEVVIGGANNVLAERRRREKLNERFVTLRSLVPFVTKTDKASILGDTIEYVKQLRKKTQQLEARVKQIEGSKENDIFQVNNNEQKGGGGGVQSMIKKKMRIVDGGINNTRGKRLKAAGTENEVEAVHVEVSIIENNALVKVQCRHREGLLLDIMQILKRVRVEITTIQSSLSNGVFTTELKAKVKDNLNGKKVTIMEVKKAILQTVSSH